MSLHEATEVSAHRCGNILQIDVGRFMINVSECETGKTLALLRTDWNMINSANRSYLFSRQLIVDPSNDITRQS